MHHFRNINLEQQWSFYNRLKYFVYSILLSMLFCSCSSTKNIKPFTTDYCSCYPEGTKNDPNIWKDCCITHDTAYWKGGTKHDRLVADSALYDCVCQMGYPKKAKKMYRAVRIFGTAYLPLPWRWGYGWRFGHGYSK